MQTTQGKQTDEAHWCAVRTIQTSPLCSQINHFFYVSQEYEGFGVANVCFWVLIWHVGLLLFSGVFALSGPDRFWGGFLGGNMWCDPARSLSSLSITQKLPDEWESNHSSLWQTCWSSIQIWNWRGAEEAPVTCNLSSMHVCVSSAKTLVLKWLAVKSCLCPVHLINNTPLRCKAVSTRAW